MIYPSVVLFLLTHNSSLLEASCLFFRSQFELMQIVHWGGRWKGARGTLWRCKFMNDMAEHHCGHIKAVRLQYQWWCHQKAVSWGGLGTLCVDYVPSYQVLTVKDTTQQQLQSLLWPLGLDMIPGLTSFVDFDGPLKWQNIRLFFFFAMSGGLLAFSWARRQRHIALKFDDGWISIFIILSVYGMWRLVWFWVLSVALRGPGTRCLLKNQYPTSHRFMGMPAQNCPTWLSNLLGAYSEVTERQREREGDYVKVG